MSDQKPQYHLKRVHEDGTESPLQIIPVRIPPDNLQLSRRSFFGAGAAVTAAAAMVTQASAQPPEKIPNEWFAHAQPIYGLAMHPDGDLLASASQDAIIKLWEVPSGKLLKVISDHKGSVNSISMSADGKLLASASTDTTVRVWSLPDGVERASFKDQGRPSQVVAISPDGKTLAAAFQGNTIRIWSIADQRLLATLSDHTDSVQSLAISQAGDLLVSGGKDGSIRVWSYPTGKLLHTIPFQQQRCWISNVALTPDGKTVIGSMVIGPVKLFALPTGKETASLQHHKKSVQALTVSVDGSLLVTGAADNDLRVYLLPKVDTCSVLHAHKSTVRATVVSKDNTTVASGDADGVIILWDLKTKKPRKPLVDVDAKNPLLVSKKLYLNPNYDPDYLLPKPNPNNFLPWGQFPNFGSPGWSGSSGGGSYCTCNTVCTCIPVYVPSDRAIKENINPIEPQEVLTNVAKLPIFAWNYTNQDPGIRHIGPMAQDFATTFQVGDSDRHIHVVDASGVALAAIQGLHQLLEQKEQQLDSLRRDHEELRQRLEQLEAKLSK